MGECGIDKNRYFFFELVTIFVSWKLVFNLAAKLIGEPSGSPMSTE